jgi:hypothetical protein
MFDRRLSSPLPQRNTNRMDNDSPTNGKFVESPYSFGSGSSGYVSSVPLQLTTISSLYSAIPPRVVHQNVEQTQQDTQPTNRRMITNPLAMTSAPNKKSLSPPYLVIVHSDGKLPCLELIRHVYHRLQKVGRERSYSVSMGQVRSVLPWPCRPSYLPGPIRPLTIFTRLLGDQVRYFTSSIFPKMCDDGP